MHVLITLSDLIVIASFKVGYMFSYLPFMSTIICWIHIHQVCLVYPKGLNQWFMSLIMYKCMPVMMYPICFMVLDPNILDWKLCLQSSNSSYYQTCVSFILGLISDAQDGQAKNL